MPKMMTDEPSVILKLKKGGHVAKKEHHKEEHGHKSMKHMMDGGVMNALASARRPMGMAPAMAGNAPMRPPMAMRRKAMAAMPTPLMKKGGKTHHHAKGGEVESPKEHKAEMHEMHKIEKELKHHESMKAGKAHHGLKAGGKVHHISGHPEGSHEHHKHMAKHHAKMHKEGGSAHHKKMHEHHKAMCAGGKYAEGGQAMGKKMDQFETKTTIENDEKPYVKTEMHQAKKDKAHGTGAVREGNAGGYKRGGKVHHKATGGAIPSDTDKKEDKGRIVMGGTIEGNEHDYENTQVHQAERDSAHGTGGVSMSNAGGFKKGGKAKHHYAHGGHVMGAEDNIHGTPKGKTNTKTGEVKESNAGGFKRGGHAAKKHFATGGSVNKQGSAVAMPQGHKPASKPVHINELSGTFKRGGKVKKFDGGGATDESRGGYDSVAKQDKADNIAMRDMMLKPLTSGYDMIKNAMGFGKPPAGSVTKTVKSTTVAPAKKHGGSVKC